MSNTNIPASHREHEVTHSLAPVITPLLTATLSSAGIVVGILTFGGGPVVGVCGVIVLGATGAALGNYLGTKAASALPSVSTGSIKEGSDSVFLGKQRLPQARLEDPVGCTGGAMMEAAGTVAAMLINPVVGAASQIASALMNPAGGAHLSSTIVHACQTISADLRNAARIGCKASCGAQVSQGEESVLYGGPLGALPGYEGNVSETAALDKAVSYLELIGAGAAVVAAIAGFAVAGPVLGTLAVIVAAAALVTQGIETFTGNKKPGLVGDDSLGIGAKVFKAWYETKPLKGKARLAKFVANLGREFVTGVKQNPNDGTIFPKLFKRVEELLSEPEPLPVFGRP